MKPKGRDSDNGFRFPLSPPTNSARPYAFCSPAPHGSPICKFTPVKSIKSAVLACIIPLLAACGGPLDDDLQSAGGTLRAEFPPGRAVEIALPVVSRGGEPPYRGTIEGCPDWVTLFPDQRILAGTAPASARGETFFCTYQITDSSEPSPQSASVGLRIVVPDPLLQPLVLPVPSNQKFIIGTFRSVRLPAASGGIQPYTYSIACPVSHQQSGLSFSPETRVLAGTPARLLREACTYTVSDSQQPSATVSHSFEVIVGLLDLGTWRFRTRSTALSVHPLARVPGVPGVLQPFATLPHAIPGEGEEIGTEIYQLLDIQSPLEFDPATRQLSYRHTGVDPLFVTPTTFLYQVTSADYEVQDSLCVDVGYHGETDDQGGVRVSATVLVRDDAFWDARRNAYRCPDAPTTLTAGLPSRVSNPVHSALAPVHGRRAVNVAHAAIRDRVRSRSAAAPQGFAISPSFDFASLSGSSDGFVYTGSSESLNVGAELGGESWQAGLVAAYTRTELRYRAAESLAGLGYRAGDHDTEFLSLHPFAAWHAPSGGHLWASLGGGVGDLRHHDDPDFAIRSRSSVRLGAYALGGSVPLADMLSGSLDVEGGVESFALEIEGGDRISSALPTLRGRDYRAGLAWSAPVRGRPFVSVVYKRLTGDGPEGAQLELHGSASIEGFLEPRLTLTGNAGAAFGLGDYEQDSWRLGGEIRFAPGASGLGLGLDLETRLVSLADGRSAGIGVRSEVGYGLWSGSRLGTVRPYAGLIRNSVDASFRRAVGLDLVDTPMSQVSIETYDRTRDRARAIELTLRHRF